MENKKLEKFAKWLLFYGLLVILWGAWVRISHSGDGCGDTWPLCHGQLIPVAEQKKTWVEYTHRLMSGTFGLLIIWLYWQAKKNFPKDSRTRLYALLSLIFTITEALLGAKLVLFKLVSDNDSPYRAFIMALHLINSLMLIGSLALTWDALRFPNLRPRKSSPWQIPALKEKLSPKKIALSCLGLFFLIACTGAIASLASTLFPSSSLLAGLREDLDPDAHFLIRLRVLHPFMGVFLGGSIAGIAWFSTQIMKTEETVLKMRSQLLAQVAGFGILFGGATLLLLAPIWMKLAHLTLAYSIWICLLLWLREFFLSEKS